MLDRVLSNVNFPTDENTLVGRETADDAGIYKISDDLALVHTIDFFTPIVDDPYTFGQISAANSVSDIYAMGGEPMSALNVLCCPEKGLDEEALRLILQGGADKMREAGVAILGGHSIKDNELKYGLAVTGRIHPQKIKRNNNVQAGDALILTKPLGTGILSTALKNDQLDEEAYQQITASMLMLNKQAGLAVQQAGASAATDITGFGLIGHALEMVAGLHVDVHIHSNEVPSFEKALIYARESLHIPGGTLSNINYCEPQLEVKTDSWKLNLLADPQTSGGLLVSLPVAQIESFKKAMDGYPLAVRVIGEVLSGSGRIIID